MQVEQKQAGLGRIRESRLMEVNVNVVVNAVSELVEHNSVISQLKCTFLKEHRQPHVLL